DRGATDCLREMALAQSGRPEQQHILALPDEARRRQLVQERAVHLLVEVEIKGVEGAVGIAKGRLLDAAGEEAILSARELVGDERRDEFTIGAWSLRSR